MRVAGVLHIFQFETKQVLLTPSLKFTILLFKFPIFPFGLDQYFFVRLELFYIIVVLSFLQGEEICVALQTHINDVMLRRYSKTRSSPTGSLDKEISTEFKSPNLESYEKRVQDLTKAVEDSQRTADQVSLRFQCIVYNIEYYTRCRTNT